MAARSKKNAVKAAPKTPATTVAPVAQTSKIVAKPAPTPPVKTVTPVAPTAIPAVSACQTKVTPEQRQKMIEVEAYLLAEKNGFQGDSASYWTQAENIVNAKLGLKK